MKKLIATTLVVILFVMMVGAIGYTEHRYTKENCVVVMVENDEMRKKIV